MSDRDKAAENLLKVWKDAGSCSTSDDLRAISDAIANLLRTVLPPRAFQKPSGPSLIVGDTSLRAERDSLRAVLERLVAHIQTCPFPLTKDHREIGCPELGELLAAARELLNGDRE